MILFRNQYDLAAHMLETMPAALTRARQQRDLRLRDVAQECNLSIPAIARAEQGLHCQASTALAILRWLGES